MRQTITGLVTAIAVVTASAAPALACGGFFQSTCSPCGETYVSPCEQAYVAPPVTTCNTGCGGWAHERLADPVEQYYYVNQGPTFSGPGDFAPRPVYREDTYHHPYHYGWHHSYHYGWHHPYHYGWHQPMRHFYSSHHYYGFHEHALRRYY